MCDSERGADLSTTQVLRARFPRVSANLRRYGGAASKPLDEAGKLGWFTIVGVRDMAWALTRYRKEILRLIAEVGMGSGAMAIIGGTAVIIGFVTLSAGSLVAIQGLASLGHVGLDTLLGFVAAFINVRLVAPIVTGSIVTGPIFTGPNVPSRATRQSRPRRIPGPSPRITASAKRRANRQRPVQWLILDGEPSCACAPINY